MTNGSKMLDKVSKYIILAAAVLLLSGAFIGGCQYHKKFYPCPEITTHTVILHDTVIHQIIDTVPYYIVTYDSVIYRDTVFKDVDTAAILKDHFALYYYTRTWEDSLLFAQSEDAISQNQFVDNKFTYRILRPQTIINNTVDNTQYFYKYIILGLDIPIEDYKSTEIEVQLVTPKIYFGAGFGAKGLSFKLGGTLFKLK